MREWLARLRDWFRRDALDAELQDELRFHKAQLERDGDADAKHRLGNVTRVREESRDRWSIPWLDILQQDVRYALRGLRRSPGFTITVVLTLGLGIGVNTAMFGMIDRLMFRPFPYLKDPSRVHRVYLQSTDRGRTTIDSWMEYTRFLDLKKWSGTFSQYAGFASRKMAVGTGETSREREVASVSATFFDFFSARPELGRFFIPSEDTVPVGAPVVVLSHGYWKSEFGGQNVLGRQLQVGTILCTIIGVAPDGFVGVNDAPAPEAFIPITTYAGHQTVEDDPDNYYTRYNWGWMSVMVRRAPGVSEARASEELSRAFMRSWNAQREFEPLPVVAIARPRAIAGPLKPAAGPDAGLESKVLLWVAGVALIVLLIACANVANLMFARVMMRRRETAVRLALGVSRGRLLAQSLTESLLLAALGCVAGVAFAQWGGAVLQRLFLEDNAPGALDWRTLTAAAACALVAGTLTVLGPAWLANNTELTGNLKSGVREGGGHRSRTRSALLILQAALSVVLLVGAALFVRSLNNVRAMRLGYDVDPVIVVTPNLRGMQLDSTAIRLLRDRMLEAARAIPGVEHAAALTSVPFWSTSSTGLYVAGIDSVRKLGRFTYQTGTADYFVTTGTRVLRGRPFSEADRAGAPLVAVVSEAMGKKLWPGLDPVGQCMHVSDSKAACTTVIGVAEDAVQGSFIDDARLRYYLPMEQRSDARGAFLMVRLSGANVAGRVDEVRAVLQRVMPGESYVTARPFGDLVGRERRPWQMGATMFIAFGVLALLVAAVGLYGVVAYSVVQRMHELGVRIALGAQARDVVRLVVGQGMAFALTGVVIGLGLALATAHFVQPLLFQQSAKDPLVYGFVGALLVLVAAAASAAPAWRATRADPNSALRSD